MSNPVIRKVKYIDNTKNLNNYNFSQAGDELKNTNDESDLLFTFIKSLDKNTEANRYKPETSAYDNWHDTFDQTIVGDYRDHYFKPKLRTKELFWERPNIPNRTAGNGRSNVNLETDLKYNNGSRYLYRENITCHENNRFYYTLDANYRNPNTAVEPWVRGGIISRNVDKYRSRNYFK